MGSGSLSRASRCRRWAKNSTGLPAPARQKLHTPWEYRSRGRARRCLTPGTALGGHFLPCRRRGIRRFDTPRGPAYDRPDEERADGAQCALARLRASWGHHLTSPRGLMERITTSPDEADLSAQEAPSRQGARLPRPNEDGRRTPHPGRSAGSGSEAPDGLRKAPTRDSRLVMLSRPQEFSAIQARGTTRSSALVTVRLLRTDLEMTRFGLATSRGIGSAVVRNRVRRRLREALRALGTAFRPGWDVLIIARPAIVDADHAALMGTLRRILERGGVVGGKTGT